MVWRITTVAEFRSSAVGRRCVSPSSRKRDSHDSAHAFVGRRQREHQLRCGRRMNHGSSVRHESSLIPTPRCLMTVEARSFYSLGGINAETYDARTETPPGEIDFYVRHARSSGGPVLELACGTGRITWPIARAGIAIVGLDLEQA